MTNEQLILWQHNAIFECECDNFINRRIEADRQERAASRIFGNFDEADAINAAIQQHGLRRRRRRIDDDNDDDNDNDNNDNNDVLNNAIIIPPPARRPRVRPLYYEVYEDAVAEAIRERGLVLRGVP